MCGRAVGLWRMFGSDEIWGVVLPHAYMHARASLGPFKENSTHMQAYHAVSGKCSVAFMVSGSA